jgi:hypothetical protein
MDHVNTPPLVLANGLEYSQEMKVLNQLSTAQSAYRPSLTENWWNQIKNQTWRLICTENRWHWQGAQGPLLRQHESKYRWNRLKEAYRTTHPAMVVRSVASFWELRPWLPRPPCISRRNNQPLPWKTPSEPLRYPRRTPQCFCADQMLPRVCWWNHTTASKPSSTNISRFTASPKVGPRATVGTL